VAREDEEETALWVSKREAGFVETIHQWVGAKSLNSN
jgi:hypothetical protein